VQGGIVSNVISISDGAPVPPAGTPNEGVIGAVERLLELARSGELQSLVATGFTKDGMRLSMWGGEHTNVYEMRGAIMWLDSEYVNRVTTENDQNG
jgi:hypothetical protein